MIWGKEVVWSLLLAIAIDWCIGDPSYLPHPIVMMGKWIMRWEGWIRKIYDASHLRFGGLVLVLGVLGSVACIGLLIEWMLWMAPLMIRIGVRAFLMSFMLAARSLRSESMRVYHALQTSDLETARNVVGRIVGRDVRCLSKEGVIRAAVETVAENFTDGIFAPFFYMACFGLIGGLLYKAINTMDSMIGYKNERYIDLGFTAAKTDDVVNFIPARISACLMLLASVFGFRWRNAIRVYRRDRNLSTSPNAGQTEAVCAGALGIQLLGDAYYFGTLVKKPFVGDALCEVDVKDIPRANRLNEMAYLFGMVCFVIMYFLVYKRFVF